MIVPGCSDAFPWMVCPALHVAVRPTLGSAAWTKATHCPEPTVCPKYWLNEVATNPGPAFPVPSKLAISPPAPVPLTGVVTPAAGFWPPAGVVKAGTPVSKNCGVTIWGMPLVVDAHTSASAVVICVLKVVSSDALATANPRRDLVRSDMPCPSLLAAMVTRLVTSYSI